MCSISLGKVILVLKREQESIGFLKMHEMVQEVPVRRVQLRALTNTRYTYSLTPPAVIRYEIEVYLSEVYTVVLMIVLTSTLR